MSEFKVSRVVVVTNPNGLHARPADLFVRQAVKFQSEVAVVKGHVRANGKSILDLLTLAAEAGTSLSIEAEGPDAAEALEALAELLANDFAEESG